MATHDFQTMFAEFLGQEWTAPATQARRALWLEVRDEARSRWAGVQQRRARSESYTDAVLEGMLPYADTPANRARGRWLHPSSTLTTDVRAWFERERWVTPTGWPVAAHAVVQLVERCLLCPEKFQEVCDRFVQHPEARGFQASLLSPILNALVPDRYFVVTASSLAMLRAFTGVPWSPRMETYPRANEALRSFLASQRVVIECPATRGHRPADVLEMFAAWFVSRTLDDHDEAWDRLQATTEEVGDVPCWKVTPGEHSPRWFKCLADQSMSFAWPELGDLASLSLAEFHQRLQALALDREEYRVGGVEHLWRIARSPRAVFLAARGETVVGVGRALGAYEFRAGERYPHRLAIDWFDTVERVVRQPAWGRPIVRVDLEQIAATLDIDLSALDEGEGREISGEVATAEGAALAANQSHAVTSEAPTVARRDLAVVPPRVAPSAASGSPSASGARAPTASPRPALHRVRAPGNPPEARAATVPAAGMTGSTGSRDDVGGALARLGDETSYPEPDLARWLAAIRRRGGAVFSGPTGCGKTYLALRFARALAGVDGMTEVIQLHPGYRYEDFIERTDGPVALPGRFTDFVARARGQSGTSVLVIDDLQRGDVLRVFGEALHALEHREQSVRLASGGELTVPRELVVLATVNTAERPLTGVDAAVRRLFASVPLGLRHDALAQYLQARGFDPAGLLLVLDAADRALVRPELALGAAHFFVEDLGRHLEDIWSAEIVPHLAQHLDAERLKPFRWERVRATLLGGA